MISLPFDPWTSYGILLLSEVFIFLLLAIDLRLLKPRKLRVTIWANPAISLYVLVSILISLVAAVDILSLSALVNYVVFAVSAIIGTLMGTGIGKRIPVRLHSDGSTWFHGGKGLVVLLWVLLIPRALEQAALLISTYFQQGTLGGLVTGSLMLQSLDAITGSMVFAAAFLSIAWRSRVVGKRLGHVVSHQSSRN